MAITCVADPLLIRLASSRSVPSCTPCRPFSIPQWPRVSSSSSLAPARPRGKLAIPCTASVSTFPPVLRSRVRRKTCASRPVRPQGLGHRRRDLDRALLDPAVPLVDLTIPVDFGLAPRGLEGGKAGLRLGKGGRDVFAECRLVLLHRQDVIASPFDHLRTKSAMREHRVARDDLVLDRQHRQEFQSGLVLVGLGIDPELGQNRFDVRGVGGHQVDAGRATVATPPGGLAVDGQVRGVVLPELRLNPPANAAPRSRRRRSGERPANR